MSSSAIRIAVLTSFLFISACKPSNQPTTSSAVELAINSNLKTGDSAEKIEAYLTKSKWPYGYNSRMKRYEAAVRDLGALSVPGHGISVYVYVDEEKRFMLANTTDFYTGP